MDWIEVSIVTKSEAVEAISGFLFEMGVGGVDIHDPKDILTEKDKVRPMDWAGVDESLIKGNPEEVIVKVYFPENTNISEKVLGIKEQLNNVSKFLDIGKGEILENKVNEIDWATAWKKYYKPTRVSEKVVIKPTWEEYKPEEKDLVIELDPGMAFGTGTHETTRMCIKFLEKNVTNESTVFDVGCGSGILGIAASKLGAEKIIGVDLDKVAVKVSKENVELNKVSNMEVREGNLLDVVDEKANIIVANIVADIIIYLLSTIKQYIDENGVFICSGIIKDRLEDVKSALEQSGFNITEVMEEGEWAAIASSLK